MLKQIEPVLRETPRPRGCLVELRLAGETVSRASILDAPMRVGSVVVKVGGVGGVWTHEQHRLRGYSRRVLTRCIEHMTEHNYDLSVLFGIGGYYHRFGYVACMPVRSAFFLDAASPIPVVRTSAVRPLRRSDIPAVLRLYAAENARRTGTLVRDPKWWKGFSHGEFHARRLRAVVATDRRGRVVGYAVFHPRGDSAPERRRGRDARPGLTVCEITARDAEACRALLAACLRAARRRKLEQLRLPVPMDSLAADVCRALGCEAAITFAKNCGPMGRVVNQDSLLRKLAPELTRRLAQSDLAGWSGTVELKTDLGTDHLAIRRGRVRWAPAAGHADVRLRLSQQDLTQLVFGYRRASELLAAARPQPARGARALLDALFPKTWAWTWWPDRY